MICSSIDKSEEVRREGKSRRVCKEGAGQRSYRNQFWDDIDLGLLGHIKKVLSQAVDVCMHVAVSVSEAEAEAGIASRYRAQSAKAPSISTSSVG